MSKRNKELSWLDLDAFTAAYLECALWSTTDPETERPLDDDLDVSDLPESFLRMAVRDCREFQRTNAADLESTNRGDDANGHDFWLTRERHGAGFWDRGFPADLARRLTDASHEFGSGSDELLSEVCEVLAERRAEHAEG